MASRESKLRVFRATLPTEDSELVICPPDCKVDHDAKYPDWVRGIAKTMVGPPKPKFKLALVGIEVPGSPALTAKSLMKHAMLYGRDGIEETAKIYEISLPAQFAAVPSKSLRVHKAQARAKNSKMKDLSMADKARQLIELGHPWAAIEDVLNLSRAAGVELRKEVAA